MIVHPLKRRALSYWIDSWDNLRAAVGYAGDARRPALVRRILAAVAEYTDLFGVYEVLDWCAALALTLFETTSANLLTSRTFLTALRHSDWAPSSSRARRRSCGCAGCASSA